MGAFAAWLLHPVLAQDAPSAPRIPLVQNDTTDPDAAELLAEIRKRGIEPLNIHRTYANAPKIARQLQAVAYALRYDAQVPRADRELIILRATPERLRPLPVQRARRHRSELRHQQGADRGACALARERAV
jgi:hypothetical protein